MLTAEARDRHDVRNRTRGESPHMASLVHNACSLCQYGAERLGWRTKWRPRPLTAVVFLQFHETVHPCTIRQALPRVEG